MKLLTVNGVTKPVCKWADYNLPATVIHDRLRLGWNPENIIKQPKRRYKKLTEHEIHLIEEAIKCKKTTKAELSRMFGVGYVTIHRIARKMKRTK